jgi:hypothetical protein
MLKITVICKPAKFYSETASLKLTNYCFFYIFHDGSRQLIYRIISSRNEVYETNVQPARRRWMFAGRSDLIH